MLLERKHHTYAFGMFVQGRYNSSDSAGLISMFSNMTLDEQIDISSLNFSQLWWRIWLDRSVTQRYLVIKNKYETAFVADGGQRLRRLLAAAGHSELLWEIPKGRKQRGVTGVIEEDIHCAVREFREETNIDKYQYKMTINTIKHSYVDDGVCYANKYYVAIAGKTAASVTRFAHRDQLHEVRAVRWLGLTDLAVVDHAPGLSRVMRTAFNICKKIK